MAIAISRIHLVHEINLDLVPGGCSPSDQTSQLGLWVCLWTAIHHCQYSAQKL